MPTFYRLFGCKIDFYYNDHVPPHFHVHYAEYEVLIEISTLEVLRGSLPKKKLKKILEWAKSMFGKIQESRTNEEG